MLVAAVSALFLALGRVAQLLLQRTDRAHDEFVTELRTENGKLHAEIVELRRQYREDMAKERDLSNSLLGVGERVAAAAEKAAKV
jgi:hypothetical protein